MNKTKYMLAGFAVFASILMLTTTCIAGPVQEKTNIDAVESAQEDLMKSFEALFLKMKNDRYLNSLKDQFSKDRTLNSIASAIENTEDSDAKASLANSYVYALESKQVFSDLTSYIKGSYSEDIKNIGNNFNEFADILASYQITDCESADEELLAFENPFGSPFQNDDDSNTGVDTGSKGTLLTCDGGVVSSTTTTSDGPVYGENDLNTEAQWVSFPRNMDGDILTPDGWVSPDDPNYDDWLQIEDILQNSGLTLGDIISLIGFFGAFIGAYIIIIIYIILTEIGIYINPMIIILSIYAWLALCGIVFLIGQWLVEQ
jgi:hypothetical protein